MPSQEVLESLQKLHEELDRLGPALKHVETTVEISNTVKSIPEKHIELINSIKEIDKSFKTDLSAEFEQKIKEIGKETLSTLDLVKSGVELTTETNQRISELNAQIKAYYERIKSINFPERLDKIDNSISAINIGIQNLQTRLGDVERGITNKLESLEKRTRIGSIINIGFTVIVFLAVALLIYRTL